MKESAKQVQQRLMELGFTNEVEELPDSTRTAQEAALVIQCQVAQIAKSIIFRLKQQGKPLLVVTSGVNRVNEQQVEEKIGDVLLKADATFVKEHTGFVIGGVPPVGHNTPIMTLIDEDLLQYDEIWAAAGHPKAVFQLTPTELVELTSGQVVRVK